MNNTCNCAGKRCGNHRLGAFLLRVVAGVIFIYSGWYKLQNLATTKGYFATMHLAGWMATGITWLEIVGGIALVLGLFTCFFAPIFAIEMGVATLLSWKMGGFQMAQLPLLMLAAMIALKHGGRGKWGMGKHCGCMMGGKAGVCTMCGHEPGAGEGCSCGCHR